MKVLIISVVAFASIFAHALDENKDATVGMSMIACEEANEVLDAVGNLNFKLSHVDEDNSISFVSHRVSCGYGCIETVTFKPPYSVSSPSIFSGSTDDSKKVVCVTITKK